MVAPLVAFDRSTLKVSFDSTLVSPLIVTEIVFVFSLAANLNVPDAVVKSHRDEAVPGVLLHGMKSGGSLWSVVM